MTYTETLDLQVKGMDDLATLQKHLHGVTGEVKETQKAAPDAGKDLSKMFGDASHVAEVAKESIGSAITNIGNAFSALASGDAKGTVTGLFDALADVSKLLDLVVPGLGAAVSAVIKIAGGIAGVTAGLIQSGVEFAISASQGKQQMLSMFDAMGDGVVTGTEVDDMLSELGDQIGITKDKLAPLTKEFMKMGVTSVDELKRLTVAAQTATAIVGEGGARAFIDLQKKIQLAAETGGQFKLGTKQLLLLREAGVGVSDIAKEMGMETKALADGLAAGSIDAVKFGNALTDAVTKKGAGALKRMSLGWDEMKGKFDQAIGDMFEDMNKEVDPLMTEVKGLLGLFDASTESGKAMKWAIEGTFKAILGVLTTIVPIVKKFFLDMIIFALQTYIALKPTIKAFKEWLNSAEGIATMSALFTVLKTAIATLAVVLAIVIGLFTFMAVMSVTVGLAIWALIGGLVELGFAITNRLIDALSGAVEAGYNFVSGLVAGITSGATLVVDAVKKLATGALDTFTGFFQIASPSQLMMEVGANVGAGLGVGMEDSAGGVQEAASTMSSAAFQGATSPADTAATANATPSKGGGSGATINVYIDGAGKSAEQITDEMVAAAWERVAMAEGG